MKYNDNDKTKLIILMASYDYNDCYEVLKSLYNIRLKELLNNYISISEKSAEEYIDMFYKNIYDELKHYDRRISISAFIYQEFVHSIYLKISTSNLFLNKKTSSYICDDEVINNFIVSKLYIKILNKTFLNYIVDKYYYNDSNELIKSKYSSQKLNKFENKIAKKHILLKPFYFVNSNRYKIFEIISPYKKTKKSKKYKQSCSYYELRIKVGIISLILIFILRLIWEIYKTFFRM